MSEGNAPLQSSEACTLRIGSFVSCMTRALLSLILLFLSNWLLSLVRDLDTLPSPAATFPVLSRSIFRSFPIPFEQKIIASCRIIDGDPGVMSEDGRGLIGCRSA
jgi:hypothetical protein